jgi:hypothetical protein
MASFGSGVARWEATDNAVVADGFALMAAGCIVAAVVSLLARPGPPQIWGPGAVGTARLGEDH